MPKTLATLFLAAFSLFGQTVPITVQSAKINVNVQVLSSTVIAAKYRIKMPKGITAVSAIAENWTSGTMVLGQGSIVKALRENGYPALDRQDAAAVIIKSQGAGLTGFLKTNLGFMDKLLDDLQGLIVSKALSVSGTVGIAIAGVTAVFDRLTPDILAQIQQFQQTYDSDGIQNLYQIGPGQSVAGTVILDTPAKFVGAPGTSFPLPVPILQVQ